MVAEGKVSDVAAFGPIFEAERLASIPVAVIPRPPRFRKSDGLGVSSGRISVLLFGCGDGGLGTFLPGGDIQRVLYSEVWRELEDVDRGGNYDALRLTPYTYYRRMDKRDMRDRAWWDWRVRIVREKLRSLGWTLKGETPPFARPSFTSQDAISEKLAASAGLAKVSKERSEC